MTRIVALVDLDDTLFQTLRKCPEHVPEDRLTALGFARDGNPLSYATPAQANVLDWLAETAELIPVTARGRDALNRARVPYRTAICAHGGLILEDDLPDPEWSQRIGTEAQSVADRLHALAATLQRHDSDLAVRVLEEEGMPLYVLAKHPAADVAALHQCVGQICVDLPSGWTLHLNDNNAALLPPHLGKQHAVAYLLPKLRKRHPDAAVIGIGDSRTDAPFMALCDFAMLPTRSQLADRLFHAG